MEYNIFDKWRAEYTNTTHANQVEFYRTVANAYPTQRFWDGEFITEWIIPGTVCEVGGLDGELAKLVLERKPLIRSWTNYELAPQMVERSQCNDPRYRVIIGEDFAWNIAQQADVLVMSHRLEHMLREEFVSLVQRVKPLQILLIATLQEEGVPDYQGYLGTHIYQGSWADTAADLAKLGYHLVYANGDNREFEKEQQ